MGILSTLVDAFSQGGVRGQQHQKFEEGLQKQKAEQDAESFNVQALHDAMDNGDLPVGPGNQVRRTGYNAGNPALGAPPTNGTYLDQADPARTYTHKAPSGQVFTFEKASPQDKAAKAMFDYIHGQQDPAQIQARKVSDENLANTKTAESRGIATGKNQAADAEAAGPGGVDVPSTLDDVLPGISMNGDKKRRVMPGELDNIIRATGSYADLTAKADPKKSKVVRSELSRDDQGNQVQINTNDDGTVTETPVKAKGVTAKKTADGVTPYQDFQMRRAGQTDIENRVKPWQKRIEDAQTEEDKISAENIGHGREMTEVGTQLQNGALKTKSARASAQRRLSTLQAAIDQNNQRVTTLHSVKKNAQKIKDDLSGGGAQQQPQASAAPPKVASMAQVQKYAKQNNMDVVAAQKAFEAEGIKVQ
jgi:hypothetical protein